MSTSNLRASLAPVGTHSAHWQRIALNWMMQANRGNLRCTGQLTLAIAANSTTILDARVGPTSFIDFMPTTANAAVEKRLLAVQSQSAGGFAITHSNNAIEDRTYTYCIMG